MKQGGDKIMEIMKQQNSTISIQKDQDLSWYYTMQFSLKSISQGKKNKRNYLLVAADMQNFAAIIVKRRTELYFVQSMKA